MEQNIDLDLEVLIDKLPPHIQRPLRDREDLDQLLEVVLDFGREPEARFRDLSVLLDSAEVNEDDLQYTIDRIGSFGEDNRAGIERNPPPRLRHSQSGRKGHRSHAEGRTRRLRDDPR